MENRLTKQEGERSNVWFKEKTNNNQTEKLMNAVILNNLIDIDELILCNTFLNAQMKEYADYSNIKNITEHKRLIWTDEREGGNLIEAIGIAASSKDTSKFANSIVPSNRNNDTAFNSKGPYNPPQFTQTLKLKSVLKGSKESYQLIIPRQNILDKQNQKRPMSCGGLRGNISTFSNLTNINNNINSSTLTYNPSENFMDSNSNNNSNINLNVSINNTTGSKV